MLIALLEEHRGHWIFTAPAGVRTSDTVPLDGNVWLHPMTLTEEARRQHYDTISIGLFLGLLHYLHDTSLQPVFDGAMVEAWAAYEAVNQAYAKRLGELTENEADELILVNDPHLMLVPEFLGTRVRRRTSRLAYFLGTPWCEPDYFCVLPSWMRTRILESLLQCDVVGFHAGRWADAFLACCARCLPAARIEGRTVIYGDRATRVVAVPFPVDVDVLERMRDEPATTRWEASLAGMAQGRQVLVRADRLDLWKNLPRGFAAYEAVLERRPEFADECWFGAVVTTPSRAVGRHRAYQELSEGIVRRINERFGRPGRDAVSLVYPGPNGYSRNCVVAALGMSRAALVNSTYDGLNLFAKEAALLLGDDASLLLSANAGVYEQLSPYATRLDPFDLDQTSNAMEAALDGAGGGENGRSAARRDMLRQESAARWLEAVFSA
jgi:trehalose 6-phosphate synthase